MAPRIVLFGATGYTGQLTARALLDRGAEPVLAGRDEGRLAELEADLGVTGLELRTADITDPVSVRALLEPGDVMVSTVGPFTKWGNPAILAAIDAGSPYIDSTGEPPFIRRVFDEFDAKASAAGSQLLTAMGYDWVPGNLAAALAVREAGEAATRVEVGYFLTGSASAPSGGTAASVVESMLAPGFAFRGGKIRTEANGRRVRSFDVRGHSRKAISASSSEHFALPRLFPHLTDVEPYLGWFGNASRPMAVGSLAMSGITRLPGARGGLGAVMGRFAKGSTGGPDEEARAASGSHILAIARSAEGESVAEVRVEGVNGYTFTGAMLAWSAIKAAAGEIDGTGALGPAEAFGIDGLEEGVADAGITRVGS